MLFSGKKVLIMGLGENGGGLFSAKFCLAHGAELLVSDLHAEEKLQDSVASLRNFVAGSSAQKRLHFCLGRHELSDFQSSDLVVKNPGVPRNSRYLQAAKAWTSDLALFLELFPSVPILAITGTKGKSSIAHALHSILQQFAPQTMLAGNIGRSPLSYALENMGIGADAPLRDCAKQDIDWTENFRALTAPMVLELSSWQLGDLREQAKNGKAVLRPQIACISNIMQDHQDRYAKFFDYVEDKFSIFHNLGADDKPDGQGQNQTKAKDQNKAELLLGTADAMFLGHVFWGDFAARDFAQNFGTAEQLHYFNLGGQGLAAGLSRGIYWQDNSCACACTCYIREPEADDRLFLNGAQFPVLGQHSFKNYCIAAYMAYRFLQRSGQTDLAQFCRKNAEYLPQYRGVPFRMECRASVRLKPNKLKSSKNGAGKNQIAREQNEQQMLYFINDTAATMPDASVLALKACLESQTNQAEQANHCLLIGGGTDKELDPSPLVDALRAEAQQVSLFLLAGSGTDILVERLQNAVPCPNVPIFDSLQAAFAAVLQYAQTLQQQNIYVLLSPGYASFGMFQNEFDRGRQFNQLVEEFCAANR